MTRQDDDREGAKPYKTYKAGRAAAQPGRRRAGRRAAGARASARRRPQRLRRRLARIPAQRDKAYRTYGPAPENGRKAGAKKASKGAGSGPRRRRRFRWWYVPVGVFSLLVIAGVVLTVLAWPGYQKFDRAVDKANKRVDKKTRAQLTADDGWIWRNGTTVLLFGLDEAGLPAHSDTIMLMHFDPGTHTINQLSIPRDTLVERRRLRTAARSRRRCGTAARRSPSRRSRTTPASPSTTSWSSASRASRGSSTRSAASTCTCRRR